MVTQYTRKLAHSILKTISARYNAKIIMSAGVKQLIDIKIAGKKVMVFSKSYCPYCTKAKKVLKQYGLSDDEYEVMEIENDPECSEIQAYLKQLTGASSVRI